MKIIFLGLILFTLTRCIVCAKIIFLFPFPARSHFNTISVLAEELAKRGHQVTMVSPFRKDGPSYHEISFDAPKTFGFPTEAKNVSESRKSSAFFTMYTLWSSMPNLFENFYKSETGQALIHSNDTYDLIISESVFFEPSILAFMHKFNAPNIEFCSVAATPYIAGITGNPQAFSYFPDVLMPHSNEMSFIERLHNTLYGVYQFLAEHLYHLPKHDDLVRKYFNYPGAENIPPIVEMVKKTSLVFVNTHFAAGYPRPYAPNVVQIGGFHYNPTKKLPKDLQKFIDEAENGVIYFSFGSNVKPSFISRERLEAFVSALKKVQQRVIFKWDNENDTIFKGVENMMVKSWLPQQEILAHPKCVLFITHGGFNSQMEVLRSGVPVIGFAFFSDQHRNIVYYERIGIGKRMDLERFTSKQLLETINTLIYEPSFKEKAIEMAKRVADEPESPMDRAVFWVEYVIRHNGAHHLKPASVYQPLYQYLLIDVFVFVFMFTLLTLYLLRKILSKLWSLITYFKKQQNVNVSKKNK